MKLKNKITEKIELMSPAGSWESLRSAIDSGCNSVYFGVKGLNMRANAKNFEINELGKIVKTCHDAKIKANLTLNIVSFDSEKEIIDKTLHAAKNAEIDAIIAWDFAIIEKAKKMNIPVHISTQASISNFDSLKFFYSLGAKCVVLARELSLEQIKKIKEECIKNKVDIKIETFCHGAMCVALSGRCFTSQFLYGRSANRGDCIQPCRRSYNVIDPETNKELVLDNHYIMSPKDLCTIEIIDKLIESGISVLKIEGRNRPPEYVMEVTKTYRTAIDAYYDGKLNKNLKEELTENLKKVYNRKFHTGFYMGTPTADDFTDLYGSDSKKQKIFIGTVKKVYQKIGVYEVEINSEKIKIDDEVLITGKTSGATYTKIKSIHDPKGNETKSASKGERVGITFTSEGKSRINDKVFLIK